MRLGKYQLLRKLATGGMAEVFLAKTDGPMGFEKLLVIKRILPHLAEDPHFVEMFLGEAKLAARLNHPNLVQLFDFGQAEGSYFIAMEYIDGPTLRLMLARARDLQSPLPLGLAARIVSSAAEGLAYAHDYRDPVTDEPLHLIHRDVSPDNILIGRSGAVKLVDFGIAKARGQSHHTQAGTVKGKVAYMAPEQLRGEPLDRRVDLYALGVVLYELCTGRMPFEAGTDASMVRAVLYDVAIPAVQRVPTLPRGLQVILEGLLAKDRGSRYPDCRTLHADLEAFIQSTGEATNGFALSRLVAQLAPPAPPVQPAPLIPPGVTASAFAPTSSSPILLSEPLENAVPGAPLEILELDRTVRSEGRHPVSPPPVPPLDLRRSEAAPPVAPAEPRRAHAAPHSAPLDLRRSEAAPPVAPLEVRRTGAHARAPRPSAFVFPTALEQERGSVAPLALGMERTEPRRHTAGSARRGGSGGGVFRSLGLLVLFVCLAVLGAYLGLAAAHRTDLLARMGLPVPGLLGITSAGSGPGAPTASSGPAPAAPANQPVAGSAVQPPTSPHPAAAPAAPGSVASPGSSAPGQAAASPAPTAPPAVTGEPPPAPAADSAALAIAGRKAESAPATADPRPQATPPPTVKSASPPPAERAGSKPQPGTEVASKAGSESDRQKLLGAFAELEAQKESTVRLESTPKLRVRLGGKLVGTTPVTLTVPASDAPVELELFDTGLGLSRTEQLTLKPGDNGTHSVVIPKGMLELKLQDGVGVTIDGKSAGTAPLDPVSLYEGRHVVQLVHGDQKERRTLDITGDQTEVLEFSFPEAE